jgi:hypothetical protein
MSERGGPALNDAVRDVLHDFVDGGRPPVVPGPTAVRSGRRIRRRRAVRTGLATLVAVAVAAIAVPMVTVAAIRDAASQVATPRLTERPSTDQRLADAVAALPGPVRLPGGLTYVANAPSWFNGQRGPTVVLDIKRGRYVELKGWLTADPSPAGDLILVSNDAPGDDALLDLRTGATRPLGTPATMPGPADQLRGTYSWSPDGTKLLYCGSLTTDKGACAIVDPATGAASPRIQIPGRRRDIAHWDWMPDGRGVFVVVSDTAYNEQHTSDNKPPRYLRTDVYDLSGKRTRTLPIRGYIDGPQSWSPDGTRVLARDGVANVRAYHATTGALDAGFAVARAPHAIWWVDDQRTLALRCTDEVAGVAERRCQAEVRGADGKVQQRPALPAALRELPSGWLLRRL